MDANKLLDQIEAQIRAAREALAEEHEGDFTRAVVYLVADAESLAHLVRTW